MADAKELIHRYFHQLIKGCGNTQCSNVYCRSSLAFKYDEKAFLDDRNQAAAEAVRLLGEKAQLCHRKEKKIEVKIETLNENNLRELINYCRENNDWTNLQNFLGLILSNRMNLSRSFLKKDFVEIISIDQISSPGASATPKGFFFHDSRVTLENDEITLDFESMKRSIKLLHSYEDQIEPIVHKTLTTLLNQLQIELKSAKQNDLETDAHFFNLFFIIFQLPFLSYPNFLFDIARLFYSILTNLSLDAQVKFVRLLAKYSDNLHVYIAHVQQYITLQTLQWCAHVRINDDDDNDETLANQSGMKEGLDVLRMLFYANLLSSERDALDVIEIERENDQKMEIELINRRQRRNDDMDSPTQRRSTEQSAAIGQTNSTPTTPTTPTNASATEGTNRARTTATTTVDDNGFPIENPLQTKLALRPNEYRHVRYPFEDFINDCANEKIEIRKEYLNFIQRPSVNIPFSFIFYPFFLSTINKIALLNIESKARMYFQRRTIFIQNIFNPIHINPFFKLCLRRNHLIEDALISLEYQGIEQPDELKKQLFVEFEDEQGHDEGGLSKEFFQLIIEQIFNIEYGMFMSHEETRCLWFNPSAAEDLDREYTLIGMLLGLAIYNSIILDIKFPPVIYRKLMGKIGTFEDLRSSHPTIFRNLQALLTFDEGAEQMTVEDAFGLTFQVALTDATGSQRMFDLKENGQLISVTNDNREEFVRHYSDLLLNRSIEQQFHPFFHGFLLVTRDSSLRKLFRPDEIELLVAGSQLLDFDQLASAAEYDGGYTKDSSTIQNFWIILKNFTTEQKRKFLRFTTGSDRAPIGGLARLKLIISRNGPDTDRLPTAHTCFNALLLPDYSSLEKLQEKLAIAIDNAEGFGLR